jgi:hypothetical protein
VGIDDITKKAQDFLNDNKVTGGKFADQVDGARDAADKAVGNE